METARVLRPGDEGLLLAFLRAHTDTTMFLQSNVQRAGLDDRGEKYQGTYAGAFRGDELVGVVAHAWNGMLLFGAPDGLERALRTAVASSGRGVQGLAGEVTQVRAARTMLGLDTAQATLDGDEILYVLDLAELRVPEALAAGRVSARRAQANDLGVLCPWGVAYKVEAVGSEPGPELDADVAEHMRAELTQGTQWIAEAEGQPVAMTRFNATTADVVQVGGVYTPPADRSRGYAACVVAQSLLDAREEGATRSILFTEEGNAPARRCYESLGYEATGRYGLVLLAGEHVVRL